MTDTTEEECTYGVYVITNIKNNKKYIGKGRHLPDNTCNRWRAHTRASGKSAISAAIQKHGVASFTFEWIVQGLTNEQSYAREAEEIAEHKTNIHRHGKVFGYNLDDGGRGSRGAKRTAEQRQHLSNMFKGKPMPLPEHELKRRTEARELREDRLAVLSTIEFCMRGLIPKTQSEASKEQRRQSMLGKNTGAKSDETKRKIRETMLERGISVAENNPMFGKPLNLSPEAEQARRDKIAATQTGRTREPYKCSKCGNTGHSVRTCKAPIG